MQIEFSRTLPPSGGLLIGIYVGTEFGSKWCFICWVWVYYCVPQCIFEVLIKTSCAWMSIRKWRKRNSKFVRFDFSFVNYLHLMGDSMLVHIIIECCTSNSETWTWTCKYILIENARQLNNSCKWSYLCFVLNAALICALFHLSISRAVRGPNHMPNALSWCMWKN